MKIDAYPVGDYVVLKAYTEGKEQPELAGLETAIVESIDKGHRKIALNFVSQSYICSGKLRVLIQCYKLAVQHGGTLVIVEPNKAVRDVLISLHLSKVIKVYESEESLKAGKKAGS